MSARSLPFLLLFLAAPLAHTQAHAGETTAWYQTSLDAAKSAARADGKPLFIYLHKPGCGRCTATWEGIQSDPTLRRRLAREVVFVSIDTRAQPEDFRSAYFTMRTKGGSFGTPLIGLLDADGKVVVDSEGYVTAAKIHAFLDRVK